MSELGRCVQNGAILVLGCEKNFTHGDAVHVGPGDGGGLVLESVKNPTVIGGKKAPNLSGQQFFMLKCPDIERMTNAEI